MAGKIVNLKQLNKNSTVRFERQMYNTLKNIYIVLKKFLPLL